MGEKVGWMEQGEGGEGDDQYSRGDWLTHGGSGLAKTSTTLNGVSLKNKDNPGVSLKRKQCNHNMNIQYDVEEEENYW